MSRSRVGVGVQAALEVRDDEHPPRERRAARRAARAPRRVASASSSRRRQLGDRARATPGSRASRPKSMATPSVVSACDAPRRSHGTSPSDLAVVDRRDRTRAASCPSTARSARRCRGHGRRPRGRCRCRTRAGSCRRARRGRCGRGPGCTSRPRSVVGAQREGVEIAIREHRIEVDGTARRRVLEERLVEVPRPELVDRAAEARARARRRARPSTRRTGRACGGRPRRGSRRAGPRPSRRSPSASAKWSRYPSDRAASLRRRASSRTRSATSAPICFDGLPGRAGEGRCRRSCGGPRGSRCRRRAGRRARRGRC